MVIVAVVESTGAVFTVAFAQVMALWRKSEVVMSHERGDERSAVTMHDVVVYYLLLGSIILREMECIDAFRSIHLIDIIPRHSSSEFILRLRS